ncbi:hypothetical protein DPEC_G00068790 [Dallia pectoralis]|uniref:Uncharacterized protein n=1 Tax=Dallia pectoralis TaxID=75939 RepID=A0ACC2H2A2_DALPE|nr:hypothetical protein DPEC_G00068790 [Dallia pectoralis]
MRAGCHTQPTLIAKQALRASCRDAGNQPAHTHDRTWPHAPDAPQPGGHRLEHLDRLDAHHARASGARVFGRDRGALSQVVQRSSCCSCCRRAIPRDGRAASLSLPLPKPRNQRRTRRPRNETGAGRPGLIGLEDEMKQRQPGCQAGPCARHACLNEVAVMPGPHARCAR